MSEAKDSSVIIVAVVGANGKLGTLIVESLLERAKADRPVLVRAVVRRSSEDLKKLADNPPTPHGKLEVVSLDYNDTAAVDQALANTHTVVCTLQGMSSVIVDLQLKLLLSAMKGGAKRFIPSDFSINYNMFPRGQNRNLDIRRDFHDKVAEISKGKELPTEVVSIFQGGFMELLALFQTVNFEKRSITYLGSADTLMDLTTWKNTAEYTAEAALDPKRIGRHLCIAGHRISAKGMQLEGNAVFGAPFSLTQGMSLCLLIIVIWVAKTFFPGPPDAPLPFYQKLQYGRVVASGVAHPPLDNDRYPSIKWTKIGDYFRDEKSKRNL